MRILTLLLILIALPTLSNAQFNLEELKVIRNYQIKAFYSDSLLQNRQVKITQQHEIINAQKGLITNYVRKEEIQVEEVAYYRELIRSRDKSINNLKKKNKVLKIGCISLGSIAGIFGAAVLLKR